VAALGRGPGPCHLQKTVTFLLTLLAVICFITWHYASCRIYLSPSSSLAGIVFFSGFFAPFIDGNIGFQKDCLI